MILLTSLMDAPLAMANQPEKSLVSGVYSYACSFCYCSVSYKLNSHTYECVLAFINLIATV